MQYRVEMSVTGGLGYETIDDGLPRSSEYDLSAHLGHMDTAKRMLTESSNVKSSGFIFSSSGRRMDIYYPDEDAIKRVVFDNKDLTSVARGLDIHASKIA